MTPADPFAPGALFSFPLFASVISGFEEHRDPLRQHVLGLRERFPGVVRSNRDAWHSGPEFLSHRTEHVAWLLQKVTSFATRALGRYYDGWSKSDLVLAGCWANVLERRGWNAPHHHFPTHWSGVYYVSTGPRPTIEGDRGGMLELVNPNPALAMIGLSGNYLHAPKDGLMLLFPATIHHFVHPHDSDEPRISIAYNFNVTPKGGPR